MTFIGKILVLVVTAFSLLFLGLSTVALSTRTDWPAAVKKSNDTIKELTKKLDDAKLQADSAKSVLTSANDQYAADKKTLETRLTNIQDEIRRDQLQIKNVREQLATTHQKAKDTMDEVEAKRKQIGDLNAQIAAVEKQTGKFKQYQAELTDLIREMERLLATASDNNADLQGR
jgi:chromosome segregation ATPase